MKAETHKIRFKLMKKRHSAYKIKKNMSRVYKNKSRKKRMGGTEFKKNASEQET